MYTFAAHCVIFHPMKGLSVCIFDESGGDNSMCMFFGHWVKFRKARNICNKLILNAITKYYSSISENIHTETTGSKNWWNLVKSLLGDSNNRSIPPIQTDDDIIHDDAKKSEMFNDFFCDQSNINDD